MGETVMPRPISPHNFELNFHLPLLFDRNHYGYKTPRQECAMMYWRLEVLDIKDDKLGIKLICNSEDKSNFWSVDVEYDAYLSHDGKCVERQTGKHQHEYRKQLILRFDLISCLKIAAAEKGLDLVCKITITDKKNVREMRAHDFSIPEPNVGNLKLLVEGKTLYCNKQIMAMSSEVFRELLYPNEMEGEDVLDLKDEYSYDTIIQFLRTIHDDGNALNPNNVEEALNIAKKLKSHFATTRCEQWISRTHLLNAHAKLDLAEKYCLMDLQAECIAVFKASHQIQRILDHPPLGAKNVDMMEMVERFTQSMVNHSLQGFIEDFMLKKYK